MGLLLSRMGGGGGGDGDVIIGAGLCFPLSKLLVSLGEKEKTVGCRRGNIGSLG